MGTVKHKDYLNELLKDPEEAASYLNAALEDGDVKVFFVALRNVAEVWGGTIPLSKKSSGEDLYRSLSEIGDPAAISLGAIFKALDLKFSVKRKKKKKAPSRRKKRTPAKI